MPTIDHQINKVIKEQKKKLDKDKKYKSLEDFWQKAMKSGIVKKSEYTLPPLDTIGKNVFESFSSKNK